MNRKYAGCYTCRHAEKDMHAWPCHACMPRAFPTYWEARDAVDRNVLLSQMKALNAELEGEG